MVERLPAAPERPKALPAGLVVAAPAALAPPAGLLLAVPPLAGQGRLGWRHPE